MRQSAFQTQLFEMQCSIPKGNSSMMENIQGDSKRWTQFRTSIFPELYTVCD